MDFSARISGLEENESTMLIIDSLLKSFIKIKWEMFLISS